MNRPFAVFDIDGTLIRWQMFHAIVDQLAEDDHLAPETYQEIKTARMAWKSRQAEESFRAYEARLVTAFENLLSKLRVEDYEKAVHAVFGKYKDQTYRYTRGLIQELKERGYLLFAVSGSGHEVVGMVADYYGFDDYVGSAYKRQDGRFTGELMVAAHNKPTLLQQLVQKHGTTFTDSIGVGDSEGDIAMLDLVEHPIAFNPSRKLYRHASEKGWDIVLERKNMVYGLRQQNGDYRLTHTNA